MCKFKSKKTIIAIIIVILLLLSVFPALSIYEEETYEKYTGKEIYAVKNENLTLKYKNETINFSYDNKSEIIGHLQCLERHLYFGDIPDYENKTTIKIPKKFTFVVLPRDNNSIFLKFDMHIGIDRNYILNGLNYVDFLKILYRATNKAVFIPEILSTNFDINITEEMQVKHIEFSYRYGGTEAALLISNEQYQKIISDLQSGYGQPGFERIPKDSDLSQLSSLYAPIISNSDWMSVYDISEGWQYLGVEEITRKRVHTYVYFTDEINGYREIYLTTNR